MGGAFTPAQAFPSLWPYVQIARVDHWFKNAFMLLGVAFAFLYMPEMMSWRVVATLSLALLATCLIASSNYVLNEVLDAPRDAAHPAKRFRPVPAGRIRPALAYVEWIVLGAVGVAIAFLVNRYFALMGMTLWAMGVVYNVPPIRSKEWIYLDVLTESLNNPIRLLLGWFALVTTRVPPISLVLAYWMVGAFFMAAKRLAEYREIGEPAVAAAYRRSFARYSEDRLLVSLRDGVRAVCRRLYRQVSRRADSVHAGGRRTLRFLPEDRAAAEQPCAAA
jgi:4-hydroxybenzoate polyprenyltransferase